MATLEEQAEFERIGAARAYRAMEARLAENPPRNLLLNWVKEGRRTMETPTVLAYITKEEGKRRANLQEYKPLFKELFIELLRTTAPPATITTDDVWALWKARGLPSLEGIKKTFAGNVGPELVEEGMAEPMGKAENRAKHSHSNEKNTRYLSRIYQPASVRT